jgi:hypothetical protein
MHRILVSDGLDPATGRSHCRPLGGSIEFDKGRARLLYARFAKHSPWRKRHERTGELMR